MGFPFDERRTTNEDEYTVTVVRPLLIIISGPPASGKTSIGRRVAHDLRMPYIGKDDIKERLFDALGVGDRSWSRKLGMATYDLLYWFVELQLQAGRSVIVESNFRAAISGPQFTQLQGRYSFTAFQIICRVDPAVQRARYEERWRNGQRHPGHVDDVAITDVMFEPKDSYEPMALGGPVVEVDTTDWATVDYDGLLARLREYGDQ
jgi:predicted kinase